jgi:hypothetical protein
MSITNRRVTFRSRVGPAKPRYRLDVTFTIIVPLSIFTRASIRNATHESIFVPLIPLVPFTLFVPLVPGSPVDSCMPVGPVRP